MAIKPSPVKRDGRIVLDCSLQDLPIAARRRVTCQGHGAVEGAAGPLAFINGLAPRAVDDWTEIAHGALSHLAVIPVALDVTGVVVTSLAHRENPVLAMITGRKRRLDSRDGSPEG